MLGRKFLNAAQFLLNGAGSNSSVIKRVSCTRELLANLVQDITKATEFRLHSAKQIPHFARTLLKCQGAEAHLQTLQDGRKRGWTSKHHAMHMVQFIRKPRATEQFGVQTFGWYKEDRKVCGVRRIDVLAANVLCEPAHCISERLL